MRRRDRAVLLVRRGAGEHEPFTWAPPGGMAESGEDPIACMLREVREETGIDLSGNDAVLVLDWTEPRNTEETDDDPAFRFLSYAVVLDDAGDPTLTDEAVDGRWFRLGADADSLWKGLPRPLHSGLADLVGRPEAAKVLIGLLRDHVLPE